MIIETAIPTILLSVGSNLITPIFEAAKKRIMDPFEQKLVKSKLDALSASAFMKMETYLRNEVRGKDAENCIRRLISEVEEVSAKASKSKKLIVAASFDAEKIVSEYLTKNGYPTTIQDDNTTTPFLHLLTLTMSMIIEVPQIVEDWEKSAWAINFEKLDELATNLSQQTERVLKVSKDIATITEGKLPLDKAMTSLKNALRQAKARNHVEMTGLSPAQASSLQLKSIFVTPELKFATGDRRVEEKEELLSTEVEVISKLTTTNKVFRITGSAGAGKTTLLRWIEQWHWTSSLRIAVRCELRVVSKEKELPSLLDLFVSCVPGGLRGTLTREDFARWLNSGSCLVIFDGFDEVSNNRRDEVLEWIQSCIAGAQPSNSFILASRMLTTNHLQDDMWQLDEWEIEKTLEVCGFDAERVESYISKWQEHMLSPMEKEELEDEDQPHSLAETFMQADTIKELTSNPLLLSTLMLVHRFQGKKLPKGRSDLYKVYIDGMLGPWYEKKANSKDGMYLEPDQMRRLLKIMAIEMQETDVSALAEAKAGRIISKNKGNIKYTGPKILEHMLERTGLLIGPGEYQFAHKSIGEFLVAEAVVSENFRNWNGDQVDRLHLLNHSADDSWRVVLFLWVGLVQSLNDVASFCKGLIEKNYPQIALGILDERVDDFILDQPAALEEILYQACLIEDKDIHNIQTNGYGHTVYCHHIPETFFAQYKVESMGYLSISGVDHFRGASIRNAVEAGLLTPERFAGQNPSNSYFFELWREWVRKGVSFETLVERRPAQLDKRQAMMTIGRSKILLLNGTELDVDVEELLFVPEIIDWIFTEVSRNYMASRGLHEGPNNLARYEKFLEAKPISEWPDEWIVPYSSRMPRTQGEFGEMDWGDDKNWRRFLSEASGVEKVAIIDYRERVSKLASEKKLPQLHQPILEGLWKNGIEELLSTALDKVT